MHRDPRELLAHELDGLHGFAVPLPEPGEDRGRGGLLDAAAGAQRPAADEHERDRRGEGEHLPGTEVHRVESRGAGAHAVEPGDLYLLRERLVGVRRLDHEDRRAEEQEAERDVADEAVLVRAGQARELAAAPDAPRRHDVGERSAHDDQPRHDAVDDRVADEGDQVVLAGAEARVVEGADRVEHREPEDATARVLRGIVDGGGGEKLEVDEHPHRGHHLNGAGEEHDLVEERFDVARLTVHAQQIFREGPERRAL